MSEGTVQPAVAMQPAPLAVPLHQSVELRFDFQSQTLHGWVPACSLV